MENILQKLTHYFKSFEFGVLDRGKGACWKIEADLKKMAYLKAMNANGAHIFMRPTFEEEHWFLMIDDLAWSGVEQHHKKEGMWKPGRMVVETSPENFQVWLHSHRKLSVDEKSYWLKKLGSDPGATPLHRWGRAPGFRNRKEKYKTAQGYPLARLVWIDYKGKVQIPHAPSLPSSQSGWCQHPLVKGTLPNSGQLSRSNYETGDESRTDFRFALALLRAGVEPTEVKVRIQNERTEWGNHYSHRIENYLNHTVEKAAKIVAESR